MTGGKKKNVPADFDRTGDMPCLRQTVGRYHRFIYFFFMYYFVVVASAFIYFQDGWLS